MWGSDKPNETQVTAAPGLSLIMVHPTFDLPVYEYLVEQSKSYMFALLDDMPANTVGVFEVNRAAIESFLAGMNTEMARELLWREYPTDQRGSYFRRFWDPASPTQGLSRTSSSCTNGHPISGGTIRVPKASPGFGRPRRTA